MLEIQNAMVNSTLTHEQYLKYKGRYECCENILKKTVKILNMEKDNLIAMVLAGLESAYREHSGDQAKKIIGGIKCQKNN